MHTYLRTHARTDVIHARTHIDRQTKGRAHALLIPRVSGVCHFFIFFFSTADEDAAASGNCCTRTKVRRLACYTTDKKLRDLLLLFFYLITSGFLFVDF